MNKFTIRYPNGIKRHVNKRELALLSESLTQVGPHEYCAASLKTHLEDATGPNYLSGQFTIEFKQKRFTERLETPKGMIMRLERSAAINLLTESGVVGLQGQ